MTQLVHFGLGVASGVTAKSGHARTKVRLGRKRYVPEPLDATT